MDLGIYCLYDLRCAPLAFRRLECRPQLTYACHIRSKRHIEQLVIFTQRKNDKDTVNVDVHVVREANERQKLCSLNNQHSCFQWTETIDSLQLPESKKITLEAVVVASATEPTPEEGVARASATEPTPKEGTARASAAEPVLEEGTASPMSSPSVSKIGSTASPVSSPSVTKIGVAELETMKTVNETTPLIMNSAELRSPPPAKNARKRKQAEETTPKPKSRRQKATMRPLVSEKGRSPTTKQTLAEVRSPNGVAGLEELSSSNERKITRCVDLSARAPKPSNRWGHSMTLVNSKQAVLIGGQGEKQLSRDSIWVLDPEMRTWKCPDVATETTRPEYRIGHSATYDPTVRCIYVYGGSKNKKWFHDVHMFDLDENKWTLVKANGKAPARAYHSATLYRHELWVFGGVFPRPDPQPDGCDNEINIFSPVMESWYKPIVTGEKPQPRSGHSATLINDLLVMFGGWDFPYCYNDLFILDLTTVDWSSPAFTGQPPKPRSWHTSCALSNNRVFIHGGYDGNLALHDAHVFDLDSKCWQNLAIKNAPSARAGHASLRLPSDYENKDEDEILVFGGGDNDGSYFSDMLSFYVPFQPKLNVGSE